MKKISFLIGVIAIVAITTSCEMADYESRIDYKYGKLLLGNKQLNKIYQNGNILYEFYYDSINRLSEMKQFYKDSIIKNEKYNYNTSNQIIERIYGDFTDYFIYQNGLLTETYSTYLKNPEWNPKTIYYYDSDNKIIKADCYFNNDSTGYVEYEYDEKGNTILKRKYNYLFDGNFPEYEYNYQYDDKKNPIKLIGIYPIDLIQKNNVVYSYTIESWMSSWPPEYSSDFVYDNDGFPIEEIRVYLGNNPRAIEKYRYVYLE